jgi:N-acetylglucosamine-6-sulfatase
LIPNAKLIPGRILAAALGVTMVAGCGGGGTGPTPPPSSPPPAAKPNFVIVILDDLDTLSLPTLTRTKSLLADQGLQFPNYMLTTALCAPSRATVLTGMYAHNHGVTTNDGWVQFAPAGHESNDLPVWLKQGGYRTSLAGKYLNNFPSGNETLIPPGWDDWHGVLEDRTATNHDYFINDNGVVSHRGQGAGDYQTDYLSQKAVDFVNGVKAAGGSQPFFLYLAPGAPHTPADPADRYSGRYNGYTAPRTDNFNEADVGDKPRWVRKLPLLSDGQIADIDELFRLRQETLLSVDEMMDRLVQALSANGQLANTWIFLMTDNGSFSGQHRIPNGKAAPYEEASRCPLWVRGPGAPAGRALPHVVANVDVAPTVMSLAGLGVPGSVDGSSLVPLLGSSPLPADQWRQATLIEGFGARAPFLIPNYSGLRTPLYNYVEYTDVNQGNELYDVVADSQELLNLASPTQGDAVRAPAIIQALAPKLQTLRTCAGATCH